MASTLAAGSETPSFAPVELSFPLSKLLHTNLHIHLTFLKTSTLAFLTATSLGESSSVSKPMGSFVYAMPDRTNAKSAICTALYTSSANIDYATRVARILARRTASPVYVGCSIDLSGLMVEEEMEGLTKIVDAIMGKWQEWESKGIHPSA